MKNSKSFLHLIPLGANLYHKNKRGDTVWENKNPLVYICFNLSKENSMAYLMLQELSKKGIRMDSEGDKDRNILQYLFRTLIFSTKKVEKEQVIKIFKFFLEQGESPYEKPDGSALSLWEIFKEAHYYKDKLKEQETLMLRDICIDHEIEWEKQSLNQNIPLKKEGKNVKSRL